MGIIRSINKVYKKPNKKSQKLYNDLLNIVPFCLDFLEQANEPIYKSKFIRHLKGSEKVKDNTSDIDDFFGVIPNASYKQLDKVVYILIQNNNIHLITNSTGTKLKLNSKDVNIKDLKNQLRKTPEKLDYKTLNNKPAMEETSKDETEKDDLYLALKTYRTNTAKTLKIRPYLIFNNNTLNRIVDAKPTTIDGLKRIKGFGNKLTENYGADIVDIVKSHSKFTIPTNFNSFEKTFNMKYYVSKKESLKLLENYKSNECTVKKENKKHLKDAVSLETYRKHYNEAFVESALASEKEYLDGILSRIDPKIKLDKKQREVVLKDEDYTLVVAGAGAGKTTTVAAKVNYLVHKKHVDPGKILIVSYTNDAVNELKNRINNQLNIPARISTFHSVGYAVLRNNNKVEKKKIISDKSLYFIIREYLHNALTKNPEELEKIVLFFGYYLDYQLGKKSLEEFSRHHSRNDFKTMKSDLSDINTKMINQRAKKHKTIKSEILRSIEEVQIANFLFMHNIDYEYEATYPYHIKGAKKLYTPDFTINIGNRKIYLEHFGIHENGSHSRYSDEDLKKYKDSIITKKQLHKSKGTTLIYTYSEYDDGRQMLEHLKEILEKQGIELTQRSLEEIYEMLKKDDNNKYLNKFVFLIMDFIRSFKINGYTESDFNRLINRSENVRNRMFLELSKPIYYHYQSYLIDNDMIDFEDMINESSRILSDPKTKNSIPDFEYVIVDEYQDISQQRFDLTKALSKITNAKIMAVGDDWQSIFAFAGSRIDLFLKFKTIMGYAEYLNIDYTYRNAQEVIDIAGKFVQKNDAQMKKSLKSPKAIEKPIVLFEYSDLVYKNEIKGYKGITHEKAKICEDIIGRISKLSGNKYVEIALLARYNFEFKQLGDTQFFNHKKVQNGQQLISLKYPNVNLKLMSVHASKGLGFDNVILLNGSDEVFGFPAQIDMDPLLRLVKHDDQSYSYAEERRLFYVALTRTKNRVFILYPKTKPSVFIKEIAADNDNVTIHGSIDNSNIPLQDRKDKRCPKCNYPLQLKQNNAYGLKLYMCTNEPEICDYLTNNLASRKQSIRKCEECKKGYLIVKHSSKNGNHFFGCTEYDKSGKGCNNIQPLET